MAVIEVGRIDFIVSGGRFLYNGMSPFSRQILGFVFLLLCVFSFPSIWVRVFCGR